MSEKNKIKESFFNKIFQYQEKGSTMGNEISAGIGMMFLSVCGIFLNMQLIAKLSISGAYATANGVEVTANGEIYAQTYFVSMLLACIGSFIIGLITKLPLVQTSGLTLSITLVSLLGTQTGLTYQNLLVICFFASIIYLIFAIVPSVRNFVRRALPKPVKNAIPAAIGLLLAFISIQLTGLVSFNDSLISIYGAGSSLEHVSDNVQLGEITRLSSYTYATDKYHPLLLLCAVAAFMAFFVFIIARNSKRRYLYSLLSGAGFFLLSSVLGIGINWKNMSFSLDSLWGRLWMVGSEDSMQLHVSKILQNLSIGNVFMEGFNFQAFTENGGNVALFVATGILTFLFATMYESEGVLDAMYGEETDVLEIEKTKALICNAGINVIAPLFGAPALSINSTSYVAKEDGAKTGIASIVASIGYFVSMFVWIIPFLFVSITSYTISFNMYGHYGKVMQLLCECSFVVVDVVMVFVGLSMCKKSMNINWLKPQETFSLILTVGATFLFSNIAVGVAAGTIVYFIITITEDKKNREEISVPLIVWTCISFFLLFANIV